MSGYWDIIVPAAGTNLALNPSLEIGTTGWAATGVSTIARNTTTAKFGGACLSCVASGTAASEGWVVNPTGMTPSTTYVLSVWAKAATGAGGTTMLLILRERTAALATVGTTTLTLALTENWARYEISRAFGSTGTDAQLMLRTSATTALTFYTDALQLEAASVATTYLDGNQTGCVWTGSPHASTSTRSAQSRAGGVITTFESLGGSTAALGNTGQGMPPHTHVATPFGLLDGQLFQRTGIGGRSFVIPTWINGTSLADLHTKRRAIIDAIKRDLVSPVQPVLLRYRGGSETVEIACHYDGGFEGGAREGFNELVPLRFVADDPYWHGLGNGAVGLAYKNNLVDADYAVERTAQGAWQSMAGGLSAAANCAVYGPDGCLYVGGDFVTAYNAAGTGSPVTVNRVAKWDGTTWSALNGGVNNSVIALAFDAAGVLYAGGIFTTSNGGTATSTVHLAKWTGAAWSAVGGNVATGTSVNALAMGANGLLYIGGAFSNWPNADANADGDNIVSWDGTSFHRLAGGVNSGVNDLAIATDGSVYVGGLFTNAQAIGGGAVASTAYLAKWTTGAWAAVGSTALNNSVSGVVLDTAGQLYIGGTFTNAGFPYVARFTGAAWVALGSGVNDVVYYLSRDLDGSIIVSGNFTTAGGSALNDKVVRWTGSAWLPLDIDLPGSPFAGKVAIHPDGRMAIPFTTSGTATASSTVTTVSNRGTAASPPTFRVLGPGTLESIVNWTTHQGIYFNYTLTAGEYLTLDLRRGRMSCISTLRGDVFGTAILPSSNLTGFVIQSGLNTIVSKMPTGTTAATEVALMYRERYLGTDV